MPYDIIKRSCKQSDGSKGTHVVVKVKPDGSTEQVSCHTSEEKAKSAVRAKHANEGSVMKINRKQLRQMIMEEISHMAVPEGGMSVLRAQHTQALSDAIAPLFSEENKASLRDAMMPVLQVAAEDLGGPGEASFHDEARSLVYDAIKVHLQDIVDEVLNAPYQKN